MPYAGRGARGDIIGHYIRARLKEGAGLGGVFFLLYIPAFFLPYLPLRPLFNFYHYFSTS